MKRITSIRNAYNYFKKHSTISETKTISGKVYKTIIPPDSFHRMVITYTDGWTFYHESWQWGDYAKHIKDNLDRIAKLIVYYDDTIS